MPFRGDQIGSIVDVGFAYPSASISYDGTTSWIFGDGSGGSARIPSNAGRQFLTQDYDFYDLVIEKNAEIVASGYTIRVFRNLIIEGDADGFAIISCNGDNATNSVAGVDEVSGTDFNGWGTAGGGMFFRQTGGNGGAGLYNGGGLTGHTQHSIGGGSAQQVAAVAVPTVISSYCLGGSGGVGGDCVYAGQSGALTSAPEYLGGARSLFNIVTGGVVGITNSTTASFVTIGGGGGGGAGACYNSGTVGILPRSGRGGGGGGVVRIFARNVILRGKIWAKGGNGGNTFAYAAGGGGGGGGVVVLVYSTLTLGTSIEDHISVAGGRPGTGYTTGSSGVSGNPPRSGSAGNIFLFEV